MVMFGKPSYFQNPPDLDEKIQLLHKQKGINVDVTFLYYFIFSNKITDS